MTGLRFALSVIALLASVSTLAHAACTAGSPAAGLVEDTPTASFTDNGDGTVTHTLTGLLWKRCAQGLSGAGCATGTASSMTWKEALSAAVADTTAGRRDWRLPNAKELASLVETCGTGPAINTTLFPGTPSTIRFWTGSSNPQTPADAITVRFVGGDTSSVDKMSTGHARLVRGGGDMPDAFDAVNPGWLDIDGNGAAEPLTDGLLALRYLFGLRGIALIQGTIPFSAKRATAPEIEAYLQSLLPK